MQHDLSIGKVIIIRYISFFLQVINTIDQVIRECSNVMDVPFGGKKVLLGGGFRQVLPIPSKAYTADTYVCSLKMSPLFQDSSRVHFKRYQLNDNMRAQGETAEFKEFLLKVGEDRVPKDDEGKIEIPLHLRSNGNLIDEIFQGVYDNPDHLNTRAILCPTNAYVDEMNKRILDLMPG